MTTPNRTLKERAIQGLKEYLVVTLYLWIIFALFLLYKSVILNEEHIGFLAKGFAVINALVLGKFMLIGRALHLGDRFNNMPLFYTALMKSALFTGVLAFFKILEEAAVGLYHGKSFQASMADLGGGTLMGILTLALLLFVLLIPFFVFTELQRVLGEDELKQILFRSHHSADQPRNAS